jgi:hypothetical protein
MLDITGLGPITTEVLAEVTRVCEDAGLSVIRDVSPAERGEEALPGLSWDEVLRRRRFGGPGPSVPDIHLLITVFRPLAEGVIGGAAGYIGAESTKSLSRRLFRVARYLLTHVASRVTLFFPRDPATVEYELPDVAHLQEAMDALPRHFDALTLTATRERLIWNEKRKVWERYEEQIEVRRTKQDSVDS